MLLVANHLGNSSINGFGVFASEDIPAGTVVWEFHPPFDLELTPEVMAGFPQVLQQYVHRYGNPAEACGELKPLKVFLVCGDNARFMNHSDTPNLSGNEEVNFAQRDIKAGEELTCDYREFVLGFRGFSSGS